MDLSYPTEVFKLPYLHWQKLFKNLEVDCLTFYGLLDVHERTGICGGAPTPE